MTTANSPSERFAALGGRVLRERWEDRPHEASMSGLHEYDGKLPPVTQASIDDRVAKVRDCLLECERIPKEGLTAQERFDRELLMLGLRQEIWELTEHRSFAKDPMALMWPLEATAYMDRSYAPVDQRMTAFAGLLTDVPAYLASVRALLEPPFAKPVLTQSIEAYQGVSSFYRNDVITFAKVAASIHVADSVERAALAAADAVDAFVGYLVSHDATANAPFAIGAGAYAKMLSLGEAVETPIDEIEAAGERELTRLQAMVREAAERIAPGKPLDEAIAVVTSDHPAADSLIDDTRSMLEEIRSFTIDHHIASVVSEVRAQVKETPAFMRWAFAAMDGPGPFEQVATEAFYYVTPVEPSWTPDQAEEWLTNFNYSTLKIISIHEVYPGHYVHFLRHNQAPTPLSKVFGAYSFWEGWAHYCEEMFLEQGYGNGDPRMTLAMAQEALIRVGRLLCSIRMHTKGQTLDEATRFFQEQAYMEELPASKEALRGTFDPGYLNYTLGKMLIHDLRDAVKAKQGASFSLKAFHDDLLSHGAPPLPLLRAHLGV